MASSIAFLSDRRARIGGLLKRPLGGAVVLVVGSLILAVGTVVLTRTGLFHVRTIEVEGNVHRQRAEIIRASGVSTRTNVIWLDEAQVRARLEEDPWVASAVVSRSLAGTVRIAIRERTPVAVLERGSERVLVAGDGTILASAPPAESLPRIVAPPSWVTGTADPAADGAARVLRALSPGLRSRVSQVTITPGSTLVLSLDGGLSIAYGTATSLEQKTTAIARTLAWARRTGERVGAIDVVAPSAPAVTLVP